jgi:hypothetical protein
MNVQKLWASVLFARGRAMVEAEEASAVQFGREKRRPRLLKNDLTVGRDVVNALGCDEEEVGSSSWGAFWATSSSRGWQGSGNSIWECSVVRRMPAAVPYSILAFTMAWYVRLIERRKLADGPE